MFNATIYLTLATLIGLAAGFAREWLLIDAWGAGEKSDAFMIASFIPEALRMMLASGLLSAAMLPLFSKLEAGAQSSWFKNQLVYFLFIAVTLSITLMVLSSGFVYIVGPGLSLKQHELASSSLSIMAWTVPGLIMHALLSIPHNYKQKFIRTGLGSLLFNLPIVLYLFVNGAASDEVGISLSFVAGSLLMFSILLYDIPSLKRKGKVRTWWLEFKYDIKTMHKLLLPLLISSFASQGVALLERVVASFLGDGAITLVNLARKLINLPLVGLMSLNQVLLSKMSTEETVSRIETLKQGLKVVILITLPASIGMISMSSAIIDLLLPEGLTETQLPVLLAYMSVTIVFGSWNALLARYHYSMHDTKSPLMSELCGGFVNVTSLLVLTYLLGIVGIAISAILGVMVTGCLLLKKVGNYALDVNRTIAVSIILLVITLAFIFPLHNELSNFNLILMGVSLSSISFLILLFWLKPWSRVV